MPRAGGCLRTPHPLPPPPRARWELLSPGGETEAQGGWGGLDGGPLFAWVYFVLGLSRAEQFLLQSLIPVATPSSGGEAGAGEAGTPGLRAAAGLREQREGFPLRAREGGHVSPPVSLCGALRGETRMPRRAGECSRPLQCPFAPGSGDPPGQGRAGQAVAGPCAGPRLAPGTAAQGHAGSGAERPRNLPPDTCTSPCGCWRAQQAGPAGPRPQHSCPSCPQFSCNFPGKRATRFPSPRPFFPLQLALSWAQSSQLLSVFTAPGCIKTAPSSELCAVPHPLGLHLSPHL